LLLKFSPHFFFFLTALILLVNSWQASRCLTAYAQTTPMPQDRSAADVKMKDGKMKDKMHKGKTKKDKMKGDKRVPKM
jgi:pentapeptide MXKDX repeat protein